jgi:hypothetical protein
MKKPKYNGEKDTQCLDYCKQCNSKFMIIWRAVDLVRSACLDIIRCSPDRCAAWRGNVTGKEFDAFYS